MGLTTILLFHQFPSLEPSPRLRPHVYGFIDIYGQQISIYNKIIIITFVICDHFVIVTGCTGFEMKLFLGRKIINRQKYRITRYGHLTFEKYTKSCREDLELSKSWSFDNYCSN